VNKSMVTLAALMLSSTTFAQDFLQQWRDSATKAMNEFRAAHWDTLKSNGWHFVEGVVNAEGVPTADLFIKDVKTQGGAMRSAQVLSAYYAPLRAADGPEYQSSKALIWFDCSAGRFDQRALERYASSDGAGDPSSSEAAKSPTAPAEMKLAEQKSIEQSLLTAACAAQI
jgi:surface-adhesin protein E